MQMAQRAWPKSIDRSKIEGLLTGEFIAGHRNVLIGGAEGLGKSMIAKNIGYQAVMKGYNVLFTSASDLVTNLQSKDGPAERNKALKRYSTLDLLIIDELGYLSYNCAAADTTFEVVNRRYETGSIIFTTNLAFKDWNKIFPGASCLTAMIDRINHLQDGVKIEGESYLLMESKKTLKRGSNGLIIAVIRWLPTRNQYRHIKSTKIMTKLKFSETDLASPGTIGLQNVRPPFRGYLIIVG